MTEGANNKIIRRNSKHFSGFQPIECRGRNPEMRNNPKVILNLGAIPRTSQLPSVARMNNNTVRVMKNLKAARVVLDNVFRIYTSEPFEQRPIAMCMIKLLWKKAFIKLLFLHIPDNTGKKKIMQYYSTRNLLKQGKHMLVERGIPEMVQDAIISPVICPKPGDRANSYAICRQTICDTILIDDHINGIVPGKIRK